MLLPLRIDLCLHAVPCLALLTDFMIFERNYGRQALLYAAPSLSVLLTVWYGCWVEHCAAKNGTCASALHYFLLLNCPLAVPYPFLTLNPLEIRIRIYAAAGTVACISFYALNALHPKSP